jgi:hypothetical protein
MLGPGWASCRGSSQSRCWESPPGMSKDTSFRCSSVKLALNRRIVPTASTYRDCYACDILKVKMLATGWHGDTVRMCSALIVAPRSVGSPVIFSGSMCNSRRRHRSIVAAALVPGNAHAPYVAVKQLVAVPFAFSSRTKCPCVVAL